MTRPTAPVASSRPEISVVVCTLGRPAKLDACLTALDRQTIRDRAEVIVVDDGPDDRTAAVARAHDVDLVRHDRNRGLAAARNSGIRVASAPIVAFTDDDCVPAADWLEELLVPYDDDAVVAAGGRVVALRQTTLVHRYLADTNRLAPLESELGVSSAIAYRASLYLRRNVLGAATRPGVRPVYSVVGANMSFRRPALLDVGLFDDRIGFGGEDEDICRRLRELMPESRLVFTSRSVISHDYDGEIRDTLRRSHQYGAGGARSYLKNADQNPTLFPAPVLVLALTVAGCRWRRLAVLAALAPLFVFARWPIDAVRRRRLDVLLYPWIELLEEAAHDIGFARSWLRLRHEYRRPAPVATLRTPVADDDLDDRPAQATVA